MSYLELGPKVLLLLVAYWLFTSKSNKVAGFGIAIAITVGLAFVHKALSIYHNLEVPIP